jgi:hypothetical protein
MMREPTPQEIAKFKRACKALDELGKAGFHLYLANDTMNLMVGPSHDDRMLTAQQHLVRESHCISGAGGGDW